MRKYAMFLAVITLVPVLLWSQENRVPQPDKQGKVQEDIAKEFKWAQVHKMPQGEKIIKKEMRCQSEQFAEMLKLTDAQKDQLASIRTKYQRVRIPLQSNLKLAQLDLQDALKDLDQKRIDEAVKSINNIRSDIFKARINEKVEFLKLLTDDQKKMLKEHQMQMGKIRHMKIMRRGGPGMGFIEEENEDMPAFGFLDEPFDLPLFDEEIEIELGPED